MMVLETDEPHPEEHKRRGSFAKILHHHFASAGESHDPPLDVDTDKRFVVEDKGGRVPKFDDFEGCHAVLITGSTYDAHGDTPWVVDLLCLLTELWKRRPDIHFSGVCFGHQLLCRMLGATVGPAPDGNWEIGHSSISLTPIGQKLFHVDEPEIYLHQMHQDQVVEAPTPETANGLLEKDTKVHVWGSSEHTSVQGCTYKNGFSRRRPISRSTRPWSREIELRIKSGSITADDRDEVTQAMETAHLEHDGIAVAAAILRFFHDEDDDIE
ncbi:unnamed protein product [Parascedosporium putredinis]|uniref:Glutamine amidotransferase domain-containing protein n=1 Tax=Parascedosporium putredinis TaxID=1442378 RepID=A0A9P1H086_9PEZI|nr:unnamed protein product [Parascedosporium putredinis]CAI7992554.1 unnamed protein product [Parascedosporium putredinis]